MSRDQLFNKFADLKMGGLTFIVQVGAYRHPENYKGAKMKNLGGYKRDGTIMSDVHLIIATKEFSTWREADDFCKKVKSAGTFDAFITASLNGKRMYLKELTEQSVWINTAATSQVAPCAPVSGLRATKTTAPGGEQTL